jgi:hypothetical protein
MMSSKLHERVYLSSHPINRGAQTPIIYGIFAVSESDFTFFQSVTSHKTRHGFSPAAVWVL